MFENTQTLTYERCHVDKKFQGWGDYLQSTWSMLKNLNVERNQKNRSHSLADLTSLFCS
jgi:hypothetical protein